MVAMLVSGVITALSVLFLLFKLDIKKVCGYDWAFDIAFTILVAIIFSGTYSGMVVAMTADMLVAVALLGLKRGLGYKKLTWRGWVEYPPTRKAWFTNDNFAPYARRAA